MKKYLLGLAFVLIAGVAIAATAGIPPTGLQFVSPITVGGSFAYNGGTQVSAVPANGGTFTCTSSGAITVTNANVTANSVFLFGTKTAGSPAAFNVTTVTVGTSFVVTCGSGDTSVYNYIILG
jgi:hypothetical protein